jgi:hypothetical protein
MNYQAENNKSNQQFGAIPNTNTSKTTKSEDSEDEEEEGGTKTSY